MNKKNISKFILGLILSLMSLSQPCFASARLDKAIELKNSVEDLQQLRAEAVQELQELLETKLNLLFGYTAEAEVLKEEISILTDMISGS